MVKSRSEDSYRKGDRMPKCPVPTVALIVCDFLEPRIALALSPIGDKFQVNDSRLPSPHSSDVAVNDWGNVMHVWQGPNSRFNPNDDIYARIFDPQGRALATEFKVNDFTEESDDMDEQAAPRVAAIKGGNFVVVWEGEGPSDTRGVWGRIVSSTGVPLAPQFSLAASLTDRDAQPDVARTETGFVTSWTRGGRHGSVYDVYIRAFSANAAAVAEEFSATDETNLSFSQPAPRVASQPDGVAIVVWSEFETIQFRRMVPHVRMLGTVQRADDDSAAYVRRPQVATDAEGNFAVAWYGDNELFQFGADVRLARFTASGSRIGPTQIISTNAAVTDLTASAIGTVTVAIQTDTSEFAFRRVFPSGALEPKSTVVSKTTEYG